MIPLINTCAAITFLLSTICAQGQLREIEYETRYNNQSIGLMQHRISLGITIPV